MTRRLLCTICLQVVDKSVEGGCEQISSPGQNKSHCVVMLADVCCKDWGERSCSALCPWSCVIKWGDQWSICSCWARDMGGVYSLFCVFISKTTKAFLLLREGTKLIVVSNSIDCICDAESHGKLWPKTGNRKWSHWNGHVVPFTLQASWRIKE